MSFIELVQLVPFWVVGGLGLFSTLYLSDVYYPPDGDGVDVVFLVAVVVGLFLLDWVTQFGVSVVGVEAPWLVVLVAGVVVATAVVLAVSRVVPDPEEVRQGLTNHR